MRSRRCCGRRAASRRPSARSRSWPDATDLARGVGDVGGEPRPRHRLADGNLLRRVRGPAVLAAEPDRESRGQDEPGGAAGGGAWRLPDDVAGRRADGGGHAARTPRRPCDGRRRRGRREATSSCSLRSPCAPGSPGSTRLHSPRRSGRRTRAARSRRSCARVLASRSTRGSSRPPERACRYARPDNRPGGNMATERSAEVTWRGSLLDGSGTIERVGSGAFGPLDVTWASPDRRLGRPDEPRGADRGRACLLLLDGALAHARTGGHARLRSSRRRRR